MPTNFYIFFISGLIPLFVGALYYSKLVAGKSWMQLNGFSDDDLKKGNPLVLFGAAYIFGVFISFAMSNIVIHQPSVLQLMIPEVLEKGSDAHKMYLDFMAVYENTHRTLTHGLLHGAVFAVFFVFPFIATNALFERRGWKYIFIHFGYWLICMLLIGALLSTTLKYPLP